MKFHPVDVWTIPLTAARPVLLSPEETARAARFLIERDRIRWGNARSALRATLAVYAKVQPLELIFELGEHGKPHLPAHPGLEFNLSHSSDFALIAVSRDVPVGIDIQAMSGTADMGAILRRLGEPDVPKSKMGLYSRWTLREARSKAAGGELFTPPSPDIVAVDLHAPEGYAGAVALRGFEPKPVYRSSL